ncbi:MAG: ATP-binding cassette domain-containing protein [Acholeplasmatales bacterium]|nr:MAG: ATP-binding cassette domain-containing protein [Acholeplasmatales bacterium]
MIKVEHLHKYYNKNKKNALHVLNDMSVDFGAQGLVVLLGDSGSGKTTLLNVIGGMDRFHQGAIQYEETVVHKYKSSVHDRLRNEKIGMIFQNYYLLPNLTVHENIALTLNMLGMSDPKAIEGRVEGVLRAVNMYNYRRRKANQLSGGQQQRVAIARALAKNPAIILADEPTGNLDSRNTLDIMRIIKAISRDKLVIMVTHERKLANYFADRIIEIEDGRIIEDRTNDSNGTLDFAQETDIYLHDLHHHIARGDTDNIQVDLYTDEAQSPPLNARLIMKNKTLYLDLRAVDVKKVVVIDEKSEVNLIDSTRDTLQEATEEPSLKSLDATLFKPLETTKQRTVINPKAILMQTLEKLLEAGKGQKLLYVGFAIGAMVVAYAISNLFNILTIDDAVFLEQPKETIIVRNRDFDSYDDFLAVTSHESIKATSLSFGTDVRFDLPRVFMSYQYVDHVQLQANFAPIAGLTERALAHGRLPESPLEVVVSLSWIDREVKRNWELAGLDYRHPEAVMQMSIPIPINEHVSRQVRIVGISRDDAPVIHMDPALIAYFTSDTYWTREMFGSDVVILEGGRDIENPLEVIVGANHPLSIDGTITVAGIKLKIVGKFHLLEEETPLVSNRVMVSTVDLNRIAYAQTSGPDRERLLFSADPDATLRHLSDAGIDGEYIYPTARGAYQMNRLENSRGSLIFSAFAVLASALSFYFIIRSSMISRMYEIGVYRSLGTKKRDLVKRFAIESAIITTFSSLIGFLLMSYIIASALRAAEALEIGHVSIFSVLSGILLIYAINMLSGVLPVGMLLRHTPAEINTKYDL